MKIKIIGAGITGATIARLMAEHGHIVEVYEKEMVVGGLCYDYLMSNAYMSMYGPHIFHTDDEEVWNFVNLFTKFNNYEHKVKTYHNRKYYDWPININTIKSIYNMKKEHGILKKLVDETSVINSTCASNFEEKAISLVGPTLYAHFIKNYTEKMWGCDATELSADLINRVPIKLSEDNNFFRDKYQGMPITGYTSMIRNMLDHMFINVFKGYNATAESVLQLAEECDMLISTASVGMHSCEKILKYRKMSFYRVREDNEDNEVAVINYPDKTSKIIRKTNYAKLYNSYSTRMSGAEVPEGTGKVDCSKYEAMAVNVEAYPLPDDNLKSLAEDVANQYKKKRIYLAGRLGKYKYLNMDQAIRDAIDFVKEVL